MNRAAQIEVFTRAGSDATRGKSRPNLQAANHGAWKGKYASYSAVHHWVNNNWGKPRKCEACGTTDYHRYEWANISNEYVRERWDWIRLCVPCHRQQAAGRILILVEDAPDDKRGPREIT